MFPQNQGDGDRSGNCQAGTTIDEGLGHPTEFDYYQLSHGGLLGTSRPAHYSVRSAPYMHSTADLILLLKVIYDVGTYCESIDCNVLMHLPTG